MSYTIPYNISFTSNSSNILGDIGVKLDKVDSKTKQLKQSFGDCFKELLSFSLALEGLNQIEAGLNNLITPGIALNTQMADLAAITGLADEGLNKIEKSARKSAKIFGTDASQNIESYKLLLSQLSPEIANNDEALGNMGNHVNVLSKTMGGDTVAATNVLTTAMNQYGVSLEDPLQASFEMSKMMNIMAAGAKEGSAELPQIAQALENAGLMAKTANVSFAETNAAIQVLDKSGKKGAEGGVALRNVLSTLSQGRFLPKQIRTELENVGVNINVLSDSTIPLSQRLRGLSPIMNDNAAVAKLFGKENSAAALALLQNINSLEELTQQVTGTNTATQQAEIVMGSYQEKMNRWGAKLNDLKIGFFNLTESIMPATQGFFSALSGVGQLAVSGHALLTIWGAKDEMLRKLNIRLWRGKKRSGLFSLGLSKVNIQMGIGAIVSRIQSAGLKSVAMSFGQATIGATAFGIGLKALGIGLIITGVVLLVKGLEYLWDNSRKFNEILGYIGGTAGAVFNNIGVFVGRLWNLILKPIASFFLEYYTGMFKTTFKVFKWVFNGISKGITSIWENIIKPVGQFIGNHFTLMFSNIWQAVSFVFNAIVTTGQAVWGWVSETFSGFAGFIESYFVDPIYNALSGVWGWISTLLNGIMQQMEGILAPIRAIWNKLFSKEGYEDINKAGVEGAIKAGEEFDKRKKKQEQLNKNPFELTMPNPVKTVGGVAAEKTQAATSSVGGGNETKQVRSLNINKQIETVNIYNQNLKTTGREIMRLVQETLQKANADYTLAT